MDKAGIYGGDPLTVGEVERLCTGIALDEHEKATDRLRALALLHEWAELRGGGDVEPCRIEVKMWDE